jgi:hypothetical protein
LPEPASRARLKNHAPRFWNFQAFPHISKRSRRACNSADRQRAKLHIEEMLRDLPVADPLRPNPVPGTLERLRLALRP